MERFKKVMAVVWRCLVAAGKWATASAKDSWRMFSIVRRERGNGKVWSAIRDDLGLSKIAQVFGFLILGLFVVVVALGVMFTPAKSNPTKNKPDLKTEMAKFLATEWRMYKSIGVSRADVESMIAIEGMTAEEVRLRLADQAVADSEKKLADLEAKQAVAERKNWLSAPGRPVFFGISPCMTRDEVDRVAKANGWTIHGRERHLISYTFGSGTRIDSDESPGKSYSVMSANVRYHEGKAHTVVFLTSGFYGMGTENQYLLGCFATIKHEVSKVIGKPPTSDSSENLSGIEVGANKCEWSWDWQGRNMYAAMYAYRLPQKMGSANYLVCLMVKDMEAADKAVKAGQEPAFYM